MDPSSSNLCNVNVGGTTFTFSKTSFEQSHMNDTIIKTTVLGDHNKILPYFEVDPDLFKKWLAPYIRYGRFPDKQDLTSPSDRNHLVDAANTCGLIALAQYIASDIPKQLNAMRVTKITISFEISKDRFNLFNDLKPSHLIGGITCPDKSCNTYFQNHINAWYIFHHLITSHNGSIKLIYQSSSVDQRGFIECEMKEYVPLVAVREDSLYFNLVHPK